MIQTVLVMVVVGLAVAQLYLWFSMLRTKTAEGFSDVEMTIDVNENKGALDFEDLVGKKNEGIRDGIYDPMTARIQRLTQKVGGKGLDAAALAELQDPNPFHPSPTGRETPQSTAVTLLPNTTYLNLKPDSQEDEYTEDNPLDLPWIASWSIADRYARRGQNCALKYIEDGPDGTTIITVSKSCESEMPHTRAGDRIAIPDTILDAFKAEVIAHELVHIYQARYPTVWRDFYQNNWGFVFHAAPPPAMPASVTEAKRSNPDTWDPKSGGPWVSWQGRWWPVPVYTNPKMPTLKAAVTVWWDDWDQKVLTTPPPGWTAFFGSPSQDEHPHEIAAVMIVSQNTTTEAGRRLMNWWRSRQAIFKK